MISDVQNSELVADFTLEEFINSFKQMHPEKASGSDDSNTVFLSTLLESTGTGSLLMLHGLDARAVISCRR